MQQISMIVALVDAYDAMTSRRPYRLPLTPYRALSLLKYEMAGKLDGSLFTSLVALLGGRAKVGAQLSPDADTVIAISA